MISIARCRAGMTGFTLIEVMVAMLVTAVGLLGLAKMQVLAISSTQQAGNRSLVAMQVGSLVSAMHANKAYWAYGGPPSTFSAATTTVTDGTGVLNATVSGACLTQCTPAAMAAYDVQTWVSGMNSQFPTYTAKVDCSTATINTPVSCEIYVTWLENRIATSKTTTAGADSQRQSFSVHLEP